MSGGLEVRLPRGFLANTSCTVYDIGVYEKGVHIVANISTQCGQRQSYRYGSFHSRIDLLVLIQSRQFPVVNSS